jgi:hypothetical protein
VQSELTNLQAKRKNEIIRLERIRRKNRLAEQQMGQKMQEEAHAMAAQEAVKEENGAQTHSHAKKSFSSRFKRKKK